mgnify:CR=1 FL=1
MTAIAMQQAAAAAAAGQQFMMQNNMQLIPAMVNQLEQTAEKKEEAPVETKVAAEPESTPDSVAVAAAPPTETHTDV